MTVQLTPPILETIQVIDVDSHLLEPPDLWTSRLASKWKDDAPQVATDPTTGAQKWKIAGKLTSGVGTHAAAEWEDFWPSRPPTFEQTTKGAWDPKARLEWMDKVGVYAQIQYPNLLGFHAWAFLQQDPELSLACVRAFNDFQSEFCSEDPARLIPLAYLPWWDVDASVVELERCAAMGHKGVNFGCEFERLGYPPLRSEHWHPILHTMEDLGLSCNFHIGFSNKTEEEIQGSSSMQDTLDIAKSSALFMLGNISCIAELVMGKICHQFPTLKFVSVESGFGYVPHLLEALDWQFINMGGRQNYAEFLLPSEYFTRQIYATFWFETNVGRLIDLYPDNVMFETDYPHGTSLSPGKNSYAKTARETIIENLSDLDDETLVKVLHSTAAKVYGLGT
jgi:uncharacterized protein